VLLASWLNHSRTLRLSVLERIADAKNWERLVRFIQRYGAELFTQRFFSLETCGPFCTGRGSGWDDSSANRRHRPAETAARVDTRVSRQEATEHLSLILEASSRTMENTGTTTVRHAVDRGDMLYTLLIPPSAHRVRSRVLAPETGHPCPRDPRQSTQRQGGAALETCADRPHRQRSGTVPDASLCLQDEYAVRLSTVADRIAERFVRSDVIDRMRALVRRHGGRRGAGSQAGFELLEHETQVLTGDPPASVLMCPLLLALEEEVDRARERPRRNFEHEIAMAIRV